MGSMNMNEFMTKYGFKFADNIKPKYKKNNNNSLLGLDNYNNMSYNELKNICKDLSLSSSGKKSVLIARILCYYDLSSLNNNNCEILKDICRGFGFIKSGHKDKLIGEIKKYMKNNVFGGNKIPALTKNKFEDKKDISDNYCYKFKKEYIEPCISDTNIVAFLNNLNNKKLKQLCTFYDFSNHGKKEELVKTL